MHERKIVCLWHGTHPFVRATSQYKNSIPFYKQYYIYICIVIHHIQCLHCFSLKFMSSLLCAQHSSLTCKYYLTLKYISPSRWFLSNLRFSNFHKNRRTITYTLPSIYSSHRGQHDDQLIFSTCNVNNISIISDLCLIRLPSMIPLYSLSYNLVLKNYLDC